MKSHVLLLLASLGFLTSVLSQNELLQGALESAGLGGTARLFGQHPGVLNSTRRGSTVLVPTDEALRNAAVVDEETLRYHILLGTVNETLKGIQVLDTAVADTPVIIANRTVQEALDVITFAGDAVQAQGVAIQPIAGILTLPHESLVSVAKQLRIQEFAAFIGDLGTLSNMTIFAPNDEAFMPRDVVERLEASRPIDRKNIVRNHVFPHQHFTPSVSNGSRLSLAPSNHTYLERKGAEGPVVITSGSFQAQVVHSDVILRDHVVLHVIDAVLFDVDEEGPFFSLPSSSQSLIDHIPLGPAVLLVAFLVSSTLCMPM